MSKGGSRIFLFTIVRISKRNAFEISKGFFPQFSLGFQKGFLKFPSNSDSKGGSLALLFKLIKMFNGILEVSLQFL